MLGVALLDEARDAACTFARCPICFDALRARPDQVGALMYKGKRVESALYHKSCMIDEQGSLRLSASLSPPWHRSPITRQAVDAFALMPCISEPIAWTKFVDWNGDGKIEVSEVAVAIAALLPINADHAEHFVSSNFDKDGNGALDTHELRNIALPFIRKSMAKLVAAATQPPEIYSTSSRADFLAWFDHWDNNHAGQITTSCLQVAVIASLDGVATITTRRTLARIVLGEAGLAESSHVSRSTFLQCLVPVLQLNLPDKDSTIPDDSGTPVFDPKGPMVVNLVSSDGKRKQATVPASATVGTLRAEVRRQFRVWLGSRDVQIAMRGTVLLDDGVHLAALPCFLGKDAVMVLRKTKVVCPSLKSPGPPQSNELEELSESDDFPFTSSDDDFLSDASDRS